MVVKCVFLRSAFSPVFSIHLVSKLYFSEQEVSQEDLSKKMDYLYNSSQFESSYILTLLITHQCVDEIKRVNDKLFASAIALSISEVVIIPPFI